MSAKENEEIDKTLKELNKLSKDPEEVAKYEEREWSIMRYDVEMKTNRELGEKEGEIRGLKIGEKRGRIEGEKNGRENEKKNDENLLYDDFSCGTLYFWNNRCDWNQICICSGK